MLTLFSIPKPFHAHIGVIQTNAIQSWSLLRPVCEVILFGDAEGTAETAARFGMRHVPEVECNEYGTPLLNAIFDQAQKIATYQLMCFVNSDIILLNELLRRVNRLNKQWFLLTGRRWRLDLSAPVNFEDPAWENVLRSNATEYGALDAQDAIDYFVFPCGLYDQIPPLAVGRTAWDNWLIYKARAIGVPVIDATETVMVIHQNHDYSHHPLGREGVFHGPEATRNLDLIGGSSHAFSLHDATNVLTERGLRPALTYTHLRRRRETLAVLRPEGGLRVSVEKWALALAMRLFVRVARLADASH